MIKSSMTTSWTMKWILLAVLWTVASSCQICFCASFISYKYIKNRYSELLPYLSQFILPTLEGLGENEKMQTFPEFVPWTQKVSKPMRFGEKKRYLVAMIIVHWIHHCTPVHCTTLHRSFLFTDAPEKSCSEFSNLIFDTFQQEDPSTTHPRCVCVCVCLKTQWNLVTSVNKWVHPFKTKDPLQTFLWLISSHMILASRWWW